MRRGPALLALAAAALLAGCGGGGGTHATTAAKPSTQSPREVVRAWSRAIDSGDDRAAARLFAHPTTIEQAGLQYALEDEDAAYAFNHGLPCAGKIVELRGPQAGEVTAIFVLAERPGHRCDAPGARTAAVFTILEGKIVAWRQIDPDAPDPGPSGPLA